MTHLIKLTDWDSGKAIYLDPTRIAEINGLPAYHCRITGTEGGERTRVCSERGYTSLVRETPDEVMAAMSGATT